MKRLIEYLPKFVKALSEQLVADEKRWGSTWIERGRDGQEGRFMSWIKLKFDSYDLYGEPLPWLKIAGEALIGWVRESFNDWKPTEAKQEITFEEAAKAGASLPVSYRTIAVDFNGVLDQYKGWKGGYETYPPRPGVHEFLQALRDNGYTLILHTACDLQVTLDWLAENDLTKYFEDVTSMKPPALIYLDDRGLKFEGNYDQTLEQIRTFKTHWEG